MAAFVSESFQEDAWISSIRHTESVKELLGSISPHEFQLALTFGMEALNYLHTSSSTHSFKESLSKRLEAEQLTHRTTVETLNQGHKSELETFKQSQKRIQDELQQQIEHLNSTLSSSTLAYTSLRSQFESIHSSVANQFQSSLQSIVQQKETQYGQELSRLQAAHSLEVERIQHSVKERIQHCDTHYSQSLARLETLYQEQLDKTVGSSEKGKAGEKEIDTLFAELTSWGPLTNTSKQVHGTDRSCTIRNCRTLIEVKNYSNTVPTKEVEKFYRDMEQHQDAPLGIILSLHSDICGKRSKGFLQIAWTPRSQMLLFVNSFYSHPPEDVLTFLDLCVDIARDMYTYSTNSKDSSDSALHLQVRIEQAKLYIEKEIKRSTELLTTFQHDKKHLTDVITKQFTNYKYQIEQAKFALQSTLAILLNTTAPEEHIPIPEGIEEPKPKKKATSRKDVS